MNKLRDLAVAVCKLEGKKKQVNIAQMCETLKCLAKLIEAKPEKVIPVLFRESGLKELHVGLIRVPDKKKTAKKK